MIKEAFQIRLRAEGDQDYMTDMYMATEYDFTESPLLPMTLLCSSPLPPALPLQLHLPNKQCRSLV
jgi:hypothetical protein